MSDASSHVRLDFAFAPVPEALLYGSMSDKAVRVWATLARHGTSVDDCYPSHRRIAELIGCAARSVQRPLQELEEAGWVRRVPRFLPSGERTSDGFVVYTVARTTDAPTAQENADPPRSGTRTPRAQERVEREPLNESQGTSIAPAAPSTAKATKRQLPEDWRPTPELRAWTLDPAHGGLDVQRAATELAQFRDHHHSRGNRMLDWDAAWRTWVRNARRYASQRPASMSAAERRAARFDEALATVFPKPPTAPDPFLGALGAIEAPAREVQP